MAATHVTVHQVAGQGDYQSLAAAIAASSSGTGAGDRSTLRILDAALYNERIAVGSLQWLDIIAEDACIVRHVNGVVTFGAGANNIRFIGDPDNRALFALDPGSGSGNDVFKPPAGCSFSVDGWDFEGESGTALNLADGPGLAGDAWSFTRCDCLGGSWASPVKAASAGSIVIDRCDWTAMVGQTGPIVTTNKAALTVKESRLIGATLLGSTTSLGSPAARHVIHSSVLIKVSSASWNGMIDLRASAGGHSIGADIFRVTIIGDGAASQAGYYSEYDTSDVRNCVVKGFARGWWTTVAWSPTYSCTYDCGVEVYDQATAGTGCITDDPDLDAGYKQPRTSPIVDAGTTTGVLADIDGVAIPQGAAEDMGAYELPPPVVVLSCVPESQASVLVTVDRDIADSTEANDATNYAVTPTGAGVAVTVDAAAYVDARTVRLTLSGGTPGAAYLLTVTPDVVPSLDGASTIEAPGNVATFGWLVAAEAAWHESEQAIIVRFDGPVRAASRYDDSDALWLGNWTVARADGRRFPGLLRVEPVAGYPAQVRLIFAGPVVRVRESATVTPSASILDVNAHPIIPAALSTIGVAPTQQLGPVWSGYEPLRDLHNRQAGAAAGTLEITDAGAYGISDSAQTLRKVILRILTTAAGDLAHAPTFGTLPEIKSLATPYRLQRIVRDAQAAILGLPGVGDASVSARVEPSGMLVVTARVKHRRFGTLVVEAGGTDGWEVSGG